MCICFSVGLDAEDGGYNEFGRGCATGVHEGGGKEGEIGIQWRYLRLVALRGWDWGSEGGHAGGVDDGGESGPRGYLVVSLTEYALGGDLCWVDQGAIAG